MSREIELENLIKKYATSYYSGVSEVSDDYFDSLVDELKGINPDSEVLRTGWGYTPSKKIRHKYGLHVGSLNKVKSVSAIPERYKSCRVRLSAKLDGLSVVSYYKNGERYLCLTRGNGEEGINVTDKVEYLSPETHWMSNGFGDPFSGAIRGEVVMSIENFNKNYLHLKDNNPSVNPRNIASGIMNRDEVSRELLNLNYVIYKVLIDESNSVNTLMDLHWFFHRNNLFSLDYEDFTSREFKEVNEETFENFYNACKATYPCDGVVVTTIPNDNLVYDEVAYKFQAEDKTVTVKKVTYEATRTGRMAPRIWFDQVELSGAMVQKCTGFNAAFIRDNHIGTGAVIRVCRSNEVIPYIMEVLTPSNNVELPEKCPNCGGDLVWKGDDLICENENESQLPYHFITTVAPVDGAGWSLYNKIIESLDIEGEDDLVNLLWTLRSDLSEDSLNEARKLVLDKIKDKGLINGSVTFKKAEEIINKLSSPIDPVTLLSAMSISGISWTTAEAIIKEYPDFYKDIVSNDKVNEDILHKINGIGYRTVQSIIKFKERIRRISEITRIKKLKFEERIDTKFKVAITGSLSMKRSDFDQILRSKGIEQSGNFKEIKYLITNNPDSGSSKMKRAKENNITIISESEFVKMYF